MKKLLACLLTLTLALGAMLLPASAEGNVYTARLSVSDAQLVHS